MRSLYEPGFLFDRKVILNSFQDLGSSGFFISLHHVGCSGLGLMVRINVKKGVVFNVIGYEFCVLARIVYRVLQKYGVTPTITSANDGKHHPDSWHYKDEGWDWRIWGVDNPKNPINEVKEAADEIRHQAQIVDYHYDVIYGDKDHLDHIHTEYDLNKKQKP